MNRIFEIGEKIVCIDSKGEFDDDSQLDLIEGKTYVVARYYQRESVFGIMLVGCKGAYDQNRFVKPETDAQLEKEISNALNENLKIKI